MRGAAFPVRSLVLATLLGCTRGATPATEAPVHDLAVRVSRILDVRSGSYSGPSVILVSGTRIVRIVDARRFDTTSARRVIDAGGLTILPGLIDAHVHLAIGGTVRDNARADLRAGFTTVADLGALTHRLLRLRDSINTGEIEGPRVLAAGIWVGAKNGVCEFTGIGIAGDSAAFAQRVRENIAAGANLTKVCLSSWPAAAYASPDSIEIGPVALRAIVDESHRAGRPVVAHAIGRGSARAALDAGVDGLAHAAYVDPSMAAAFRQRGMWMIPTLASLTGGDSSAASRALAESVRIAHRAGVPLVFGTDGGVLPHGQGAEELRVLVAAGLTPRHALLAATIEAARALGISDTVGVIAPGMSADLIGVAGDPLGSITVMRDVRLVIARGRVARLPE